ncbi:MAG: hypothetical protein WEB58_17040 [Planctomycetaceae bacterium]
MATFANYGGENAERIAGLAPLKNYLHRQKSFDFKIFRPENGRPH